MSMTLALLCHKHAYPFFDPHFHIDSFYLGPKYKLGYRQLIKSLEKQMNISKQYDILLCPLLIPHLHWIASMHSYIFRAPSIIGIINQILGKPNEVDFMCLSDDNNEMHTDDKLQIISMIGFPKMQSRNASNLSQAN